MFVIDFSSTRYVSGKVRFVEETRTVEHLADALDIAPNPGRISLLNQPSTYFPEVLVTAWDRTEAAYAPDEWFGARFENLGV